MVTKSGEPSRGFVGGSMGSKGDGRRREYPSRDSSLEGKEAPSSITSVAVGWGGLSGVGSPTDLKSD